MLMMPIIILLVVAVLLFNMVGSTITNVMNGGVVEYDEAKFQDYANAEYSKAFGNMTAFEDNLLIVFLANEAADGYYCIAWVGDNIQSDINLMFGNDSTAFGQTVLASIDSDYYVYSLDSNLATVMDTMSKKVTALDLESSFKKEYSHNDAPDSHVKNYTALEITEVTVNDALVSFTEATDIPVVIVVDTMENVFGKTMPISDIIIIIALVALAVIAVYMIVRAVKNRRNSEDNSDDSNNNSYNNNNSGWGNNSRW